MKGISYLKSFILKDELIDENKIYESEGLTYIPVKREMHTVIYKTKMFVMSDKKLGSIPNVFIKKWKRRTEGDFRRLFNMTSEIQLQQKIVDLINEGLIVKVIEYKSRGTTVKREYFIPSAVLNRLWIGEDREKLAKDMMVNTKYIDEVKQLKNNFNHSGFEIVRKTILQELENNPKVSKRTNFLTALLVAASKSQFYDWKEIGLYSICGEHEKLKTKIFDSQKNEYLKELELLLGTSIGEVGLTTISGEYFIEFCGRCTIDFSFGSFYYKKAEFRSNLTDEEVFDIDFIDKKDIKRIYLFENRAMLRKIIKHTSEDRRKNIAMVSFDGQVRSSQYYFCKKWMEAGVKELVVWTDFDEYALYMIQKLYNLGFESFQSVILKDNKLTLGNFAETREYLENFKSTGYVIEQEKYLKDLNEIVKILDLEGE